MTKIKTFKQHLMEANTEGDVMEHVIVDSWNSKKPVALGDIKPDVAEKVLKYLTDECPVKLSGEAISTGRTADVTISKKWKGGNKTPKTDISIGKTKISVKMGAAQLMSGGPEETTSTFECVADEMGLTKSTQFIKIVEDINSKFTRALTKSGNVDAELKAGTNDELALYNKYNKELMKDMTDYFNNNDEFFTAFVIEAMSGRLKFAGNMGTADYVFCTSKNGAHNKLYEVDDSTFVKKVKSGLKVTVRFKSTSQKAKGVKTGRYSYWTVLGLVTKEIKESLNESGVMSESAIKDLWNKLTGLFQKAWAWVKESFANFMEFFNIEEFDVKGEVNWSSI